MSLTNIIGPIMVGPSSSHTAGAVRIGQMARILLKDTPVSAKIYLHGSFATTGEGHGTDRALVAGILGMKPDDMRIPDSFTIAEQEKFQFSIEPVTIKNAHPNTALIKLKGEHGRELEVQASSVGGGQIMINKIDGIEVNFNGQSPTLIIHNLDQPGHVAEVTSTLSQKSVNIATMQLYREKKGAYAVMVIETDQLIPEEVITWLEHLDGIIKVTYFNGL